MRPGGGSASRRPRWGASEGAGPDRSRPSRDAARPTGEWTPRGPGADSAGPRRGDGPRFGDRRPERSDFGRSEERRFERRPERGDRFERRGDAGRPPRPSGPRPSGARPSSPRTPDGSAGPRFLPRGGARPRPPAELVGLQRRGPAGRSAEPSEGDHFAGAAPSDLIWGRHSAQAALESGRPIHRIWCTPEMRFSPRFLQLLREAKAGGVLVEEVTWARLGQISGGAVHQGIVLQPAAAETLDLPSLIEGCRGTGESPLLIAVDGLTDPQNLGAIVRSAEALGAHGLVLPQRRNAGLTGSVAKVAAGALEHLPVARVVNLNRSLEALKDEGYRVIGLASEGSITLEEADLDGPLVVVTGSEGDGLSLLTRKHCDQLVRIPLRGTTPSLNASVATALLLYEIARRGWMQGLRGNSPAPRLVRPALPAPAALNEAARSAEPDLEVPPLPASAQASDEVAADDGLAQPVVPATLIPVAEDPVQASAEPVEAAWHAAIGAEPEAPAAPEPLPLAAEADTPAEPAAAIAASPASQAWGTAAPAVAPDDSGAAVEPAFPSATSDVEPAQSRDGGLSFEGDIRL